MNIQDQPKAYQQEWIEFYKLRFKVIPDVLIPRPETELLVDEVIRFVKEIATVRQSEPRQSLTVLDLGTGSGNIIISLAKNLSHIGGVTFIATDISPKALEVAKQNAKLHGVQDKITFVRSDLLDVIAIRQLAEKQSSVDIIVTNLPYIPSARIPYLNASVKDFEPHVALDGGPDGFDLYRKLFQQLKEKSWLARRSLGEGRKLKIFVGEIDYTHGELAVSVAQKYFPDTQVEVKTDLAHKQRILLIRQLL